MSNLLDKVNKIGAAGVTPEEFEKTWGVTQEAEVSSMMKFIKRQQFEAKAVEGKERCMRVLSKLRDIISEQTERAAMVRDVLFARYPAVQFRNLDKLTDEQVEQIAEDLEILKLLEEEEKKDEQ